jgi:hypothetical protein
MNWMQLYIVGIVLILAVLLPVILILIRQTVKHQRQEVIKDLAAVFDLPTNAPIERLIPSFEFVKFKYFVGSYIGAGGVREPTDFPRWSWHLAVLPFAIVTGTVGWFCISVLLRAELPTVLQKLINSTEPLPLWSIGICSAFLAAYLAALRRLYQAINNFDLSPSLFFSAMIDMITGVLLSVVFLLGFDALSGAADAVFDIKDQTVSRGIVIITSFAIGYFPEAAQRAILTSSRLRNFKRERNSVYKLFEAIPVELIDGIDTEIRDRLADFHIVSVQNLATANPLMLFVETPYGVYQIMDWVAQAQLCSSVGPDAVAGLWRLGVRTLFDLERVALDDRCSDDALLMAIGSAILPAQPSGSPTLLTVDAIKANIQMRLDDPHVHRLRQIYMQVGERIGERHWRFIARSDQGFNAMVSTAIGFIQPDRIRDPNRSFRFRTGDRLKILGGVNDGMNLTVKSASGFELETEEQTVATEAASSNNIRNITIVKLNAPGLG